MLIGPQQSNLIGEDRESLGRRRLKNMALHWRRQCSCCNSGSGVLGHEHGGPVQVTPTCSVQNRAKAKERGQNSEQCAGEGCAVHAVASINVSTLAPKQDA